MNIQHQLEKQRVLIASSHALFGKGLQSLFLENWGDQISVVGLVSNVVETMSAIEIHQPDLVVVDYDDEEVAHSQESEEAEMSAMWGGGISMDNDDD